MQVHCAFSGSFTRVNIYIKISSLKNCVSFHYYSFKVVTTRTNNARMFQCTMDPAQFNPPLPYDRYVNRELPILPHSASSQSISHDFFDDSPQGNLSQHGGGVSSNMAADPFSQQFEKPIRMSGRPVLPWMGTGSDHGLVDLPLPDCGQVDPMMMTMTTQMQPMSSTREMNGNSLPVDKVLSAVSARDKNAPATVRSWTLTRESTVTQRKPCWTDCRPCQYIGLFVFVGVLAVIGYAVYNGGKLQLRNRLLSLRYFQYPTPSNRVNCVLAVRRKVIRISSITLSSSTPPFSVIEPFHHWRICPLLTQSYWDGVNGRLHERLLVRLVDLFLVFF